MYDECGLKGVFQNSIYGAPTGPLWLFREPRFYWGREGRVFGGEASGGNGRLGFYQSRESDGGLKDSFLMGFFN
jgi:hypothetical protein